MSIKTSLKSTLVLAVALLLGCSDPPLRDTATVADATTTTTTTTATTNPLTDPGPPTPTPPTTTTNPNSNFLTPPDGGDGGGPVCSLWSNDCPEGQKCMPVSLDGDNAWESLACAPLVHDPAGLYEPCEHLGTGLDGLDTCAAQSLCYIDHDTQKSACIGLCTGEPDRQTCVDPDADCRWIGESPPYFLCYPACDPLAQDCPLAWSCTLDPDDPNSFRCDWDNSGDDGHIFNPCDFYNTCDPGLYCLAPDLATECDPMSSGCCLPFCDLSEPNTCPGQNQQCLPWYEPNQAPPGQENIGICGLPTP